MVITDPLHIGVIYIDDDRARAAEAAHEADHKRRAAVYAAVTASHQADARITIDAAETAADAATA